MNSMHPIGKVSKNFLEKVILSKLGATRPEILSNPRYGTDTGAIKISEKKIMVFCTDPISIIPSLGLIDSGWLSAHMLANDFVTSGLSPEYATLNFNLPPKITNEDFKIYWDSLIKEFNNLEISVVSGHTGRYIGCDYSIIGAGTIMGIGKEEHYIDTSMARTGDSIIITKGIAIEATSILAKSFPNIIAEKIGKSIVTKAQNTFHDCAVIQDASIASSIGVRDNGVTTMHDATEGGLYGGLTELASASSKGLQIEKNNIPLSNEAEKICTLFGLDPYTTLSSGTIIITVKPEKEIELINTLKSKGIISSIIGKVTSQTEGCYLKEEGTKKPLNASNKDQYWEAFWSAYKQGWT